MELFSKSAAACMLWRRLAVEGLSLYSVVNEEIGAIRPISSASSKVVRDGASPHWMAMEGASEPAASLPNRALWACAAASAVWG